MSLKRIVQRDMEYRLFIGAMVALGSLGACSEESLNNQASLSSSIAVSSDSSPLECPRIDVEDQGGFVRVYSHSDSSAQHLRYQFSISQVVRECVREGSQVALKIGVAGQVLLGPAGTPGSFTVPITFTIQPVSKDQPSLVKTFQISAFVPGQARSAPFQLVTPPLYFPFTQNYLDIDYNVSLSLKARKRDL